MFEKLFEKLSTLPIAYVANEVTGSVLDNVVTILSSATGSGKTLVGSASLAEQSDGRVVVCVPRRYLAVNACETIAELAELSVGEEVGYAVGRQSGEQSRMSPSTKLLFVTYGYAISSGIINTSPTFVFDEVHEAGIDMSIARALVYRRMQKGEKVNLMEMSATINSQRQAKYWEKVASTKIFEIDGRTFACERLHANNGHTQSICEEVIKLISNRARKGVLAFRPGVGEVEETAQAIRFAVVATMKKIEEEVRTTSTSVNEVELLEQVRIAQEASPLFGLEVSTIYGEMEYGPRKEATNPPTAGRAKVLVGTNVVESGANIPWLDAGVTCGTGKELTVSMNGAVSLQLVHLSKWRLEQQEGRVKRFQEGIFVLCSDQKWEDRQAETSPEILRLPLTELVMHCALFGLRAHDLTFDYEPSVSKIEKAEKKLQLLGLIDQDCKMTSSGKWISGLPVSPEVGAMLWHAKMIGVLGAVLPLASVIETGGIRKDFRHPHGMDRSSDYLDGLKTYQVTQTMKGFERKKFIQYHNVGYKRLEATTQMEKALRSHFNGEASSTLYATDDQLRQCILAGFLEHVQIMYGNSSLSEINIGNGSAVAYCNTRYAIAHVRIITPKDTLKPSFPILEKVTEIQEVGFSDLAKIRPEIFATEKHETITRLNADGDTEVLHSLSLGSMCIKEYWVVDEIATSLPPTLAEEAEILVDEEIASDADDGDYEEDFVAVDPPPQVATATNLDLLSSKFRMSTRKS